MNSVFRVRLRFAIALVGALASAPMAIATITARQSAEPVKKNTDAPEPSRRQAFSVALLLGDMKPGESVEALPVVARKALADTKDFLPYKSYRLLDTQWTLCCSGTNSAITRLRGPDDQEYELELRAQPIFSTKSPGMAFEPGALSVRFVLRELTEKTSPPIGSSGKSDPERGSDGPTKEMVVRQAERHAQIQQELFQLEREELALKTEVTTLRGKVDVGLADPEKLKQVDGQLTLVRRRIAALKNELNTTSLPKSWSIGGKAIIDTSFRMDVGETVVVGTSGLKGGNRALIALLTAVSSPARSR